MGRVRFQISARRLCSPVISTWSGLNCSSSANVKSWLSNTCCKTETEPKEKYGAGRS
jgi:hypothetical protein